MRYDQLPEGVPASNHEKRQTVCDTASSDRAGFAAPDMATPRFTRETPAAKPNAVEFAAANDQRPFAAASGFDDNAVGAVGALSASRKPVSDKPLFSTQQMILLAALLLLLGMLGAAIMIFSSNSQLPLCADQPTWNQYNCRTY